MSALQFALADLLVDFESLPTTLERRLLCLQAVGTSPVKTCISNQFPSHYFTCTDSCMPSYDCPGTLGKIATVYDTQTGQMHLTEQTRSNTATWNFNFGANPICDTDRQLGTGFMHDTNPKLQFCTP